jgi:hypothetical protein
LNAFLAKEVIKSKNSKTEKSRGKRQTPTIQLYNIHPFYISSLLHFSILILLAAYTIEPKFCIQEND